MKNSTQPSETSLPLHLQKPFAMLGRWPYYAGYPLQPRGMKRGVCVQVCTHWQCSTDADASTVNRLVVEIVKAIERAIKGLEACSHTPDPDGMRAYCLAELRAGRPAIVPHPGSVRTAQLSAV